MFLQDFLLPQGVLVVDPAPVANVQTLGTALAHSIVSPHDNFPQSGMSVYSIEIFPGDVPVLKLHAKPSTEIFPGDVPVLKS